MSPSEPEAETLNHQTLNTSEQVGGVKHLEDELDDQLADDLLETVESHLNALPSGSNGLLIEASLAFSTLFSPHSHPTKQVPPALALFSYSSDAFKDQRDHMTPPDVKVVEVHAFEPFDSVYNSTKVSIQKEGFFELKKDIVFVVGGPGSGKGTQSAKLAKDFNLLHLSAGDLLRAEVAAGTEIGLLAEGIMKEGKIVPQDIMIGLLKKAIDNDTESNGILIDGFPRALDQAIKFENVVRPATAILNFNCPLDVLEARLIERGKTSGRADDNLETIRKRFNTFQEQSLPALKYFGERVITIDGSVAIDTVYENVLLEVSRLGLFEPKKSVVFAISDGSCPEEVHLLSLRLASEYNLSLLTFGGSELEEYEVVAEIDSKEQVVEEEISAETEKEGVVAVEYALDQTLNELDAQLAEHLLETVRAAIANNFAAEKPAMGILVEASLGFSPLFDGEESTRPAIALFSYAARDFEDNEHFPNFDDSLNVVEVHSFDPFETVYDSVKASVLHEGLLDVSLHSVKNFSVIFAIGDGLYAEETHLLATRLAHDYDLTLVSFGDTVDAEVEVNVEEAVVVEEAVQESTVEEIPASTVSIEKEAANVDAESEEPVKNELSIDETRDDLDGELAEHILEAVRADIEKHRADGKTEGILVEASLGFSPLFDGEGPAVALFSYSTSQFEDNDHLPDFDDAVNVVEVHSFAPFDKVYQTVKKSVLDEGMLNISLTSGRHFNVIFLIGDGHNQVETHLLSTQLAKDYNLSLLTIGVDASVEAEAQEFGKLLNASRQLEVLVEEEEIEEEIEVADTNQVSNKEVDAIVDEMTSNLADLDSAAIADEANTSRIQELEENLKDAQGEIAKTAGDVAANINALLEERITLLQERQADGQLIQELMVKVDTLALEAAEEVKALMTENEELRDALEKKQGDHIAIIESQEKSALQLQTELTEALERVRDGDVKYGAVVIERDLLQRQVSVLSLETEKERLLRHNDAAAFDVERTELLARIKQLEATVTESKAAHSQVKEAFDALSGRHKDLWELHKSTTTEHNNNTAIVEDQILRLQSELNTVIAERGDALQDLADAEEELKAAHQRIHDLNDVIQMMKTHIARLVEQSRKSRVVVLEDHVVKLEKTIGSLKAEVQFLKGLVSNKK
ncbi:hypothetical protein HDU79_008866 [Rhizoclosmatium sp. JEL0117]|nr:hypothetical protein HDU79_008866 [Rhizoclosmatium sp. JEL0117]